MKDQNRGNARLHACFWGRHFCLHTSREQVCRAMAAYWQARPTLSPWHSYPMLLYERFLGRPFAGHRDSVSDVIGQTVEIAIEEVLHEHGISARKTKRAERVKGFEQTPDFIIPDEFNPQIVIEAKLAEDDGTARDKVTRVQHLYTMSMRDRTPKQGPRYDVIACIAGRGFKQRREDMKEAPNCDTREGVYPANDSANCATYAAA